MIVTSYVCVKYSMQITYKQNAGQTWDIPQHTVIIYDFKDTAVEFKTRKADVWDPRPKKR